MNGVRTSTKKQKNIKKSQSKELKNTVTEMTNALEVINRRWEDAEDWISDLEDTVVEITQLEWQKIKIKKKIKWG